MKFSNNYETLVALIIHLSACERRSKSSEDIYNALGEVISKDNIGKTLENFPSFFRKARNNQNTYTVHLRYAKRRKDDSGNTISAPLNADEVEMQLDQLAKIVALEREDKRLETSITESRKNLEEQLKMSRKQFKASLDAQDLQQRNRNYFTLIVAGISAVAAIIAALFSFNPPKASSVDVGAIELGVHVLDSLFT